MTTETPSQPANEEATAEALLARLALGLPVNVTDVNRTGVGARLLRDGWQHVQSIPPPCEQFQKFSDTPTGRRPFGGLRVSPNALVIAVLDGTKDLHLFASRDGYLILVHEGTCLANTKDVIGIANRIAYILGEQQFFSLELWLEEKLRTAWENAHRRTQSETDMALQNCHRTKQVMGLVAFGHTPY